MSLNKHGMLTHLAECDNCGEEMQTDAEDWHDALDEIKRDGWTVKNINGEWEHWCQDCSNGG